MPLPLPTASEPVLCPACDRLHLRTRLAPGQVARCSRCGERLYGKLRTGMASSLAMTLASLFGYLVAIGLPFLHIGVSGQKRSISLGESVRILWEHDMVLLALFVMLLILLAPLVQILGRLHLVGSRYFRRMPFKGREVARLLGRCSPWDMSEVYLASILVVMVKITDIADFAFGSAFWMYVLQVGLLTTCKILLPTTELWRLIPDPEPLCVVPARPVRCEICATVHEDGPSHCRKCHHPLHFRKPASLDRTMAYTLTALICIIPANTYPILTTRFFGSGVPSTIIGGVFHLWEADAIGLALVVFLASVVIPFMKIAILLHLWGCVRFGKLRRTQDRTRLYRLTEFIGKWSMVDVFVVATLAALVQFGAVASVTPGFAASAFCATVVATLAAAESFDPRLLWDPRPPSRRT